MDDNSLGPEINSVEYWNARFLEDWVAKGGRKQTEFFASLSCRELPRWLVHDVETRKLSVLDYGCALGDALPVLQKTFARSSVTGGDTSAVGIALARVLHPHYEFIDLSKEKSNSTVDDVVYCSNTLEHIEQWKEFLFTLSQRAKEYLIIVVPFEEQDLMDEHVTQFDLDTLPPTLRAGMRMLHLTVVDAGLEADTHWNGLQLISIYGRRPPGGRRWPGESRQALDGAREPHAASLIFDLRQVKADAVPPLVRTFAELSRRTRRIRRDWEAQFSHSSVMEGAAADELSRNQEAQRLLVSQLEAAEARFASRLEEAEARSAAQLEEAEARSEFLLEEVEAGFAAQLVEVEARSKFLLDETEARFASEREQAAAASAARLEEVEARSKSLLDEAEARFASQLEKAEQKHVALERQWVAVVAEVEGLTSQLRKQRQSYETAIWERDRAWRHLREIKPIGDDGWASLHGRVESLRYDLEALVQRLLQGPPLELGEFGEQVRGALVDDNTEIRPSMAPQTLDPILQELAALEHRTTLLLSQDSKSLIRQLSPLVSIIMPVYNQADLVDEAIVGVLSQTYLNWEMIILDDGSKDDLEIHVRKYERDHRVLFLRQPNLKLPTALNNAFRYSRGELLMWTSADNVMLPRQVERLVGALSANPTAGIAYSDYWAIDDAGSPLDDPSWRSHNRDPKTPGLIRLPSMVTIENFHLSGDNFIGASFMYRRAVSDIVGWYAADKFGGEDYDFWLRAHLVTEFYHLKEPLYKYRVHDNTLTARRHILGLDANVREVLEADRWRIETFLTDGSLRSGAPLLRDADQFHAAILDHFRPIKYSDLVRGSQVDEREAPVVVDLDVPVRLIDERHLRAGDIVLCRSELAFVLLRRAEGTHHKRVLRWRGDLDAAAYHAFVQAFVDRVADSVNDEVSLIQPRIDEAFVPHTILLVVDTWSSGGLENVIVDLAHSFARAGQSVFIGVAGGLTPSPALFSEYSRIQTLSFHGSDAELENFLTQHPVDVINYHHSFFGSHIAGQRGVTCVYTMHNCYLWMDDEARRQVAIELTTMDRVIAVSRQVAQFAVAQFNYPAERLAVILNGLPGDVPVMANKRVAVPGEPFTVVIVASLMRLKLQHVAVAAFSQLAAEIPELRLRLIGMPLDQPYYGELETLVAQLSCRDRIEIIPGLTRTLVLDELRSAHVFVLPSALEGCSLALIEAIAAGCVCISSDVGAAHDFQIPGGSVLIIPSPLGELDDVTQRDFYEAISMPLSEHQAHLVTALRRVWQEYGLFAARVPATQDHLRRSCNMQRITDEYLQAYTFAIRGGQSVLRPNPA